MKAEMMWVLELPERLCPDLSILQRNIRHYALGSIKVGAQK